MQKITLFFQFPVTSPLIKSYPFQSDYLLGFSVFLTLRHGLPYLLQFFCQLLCYCVYSGFDLICFHLIYCIYSPSLFLSYIVQSVNIFLLLKILLIFLRSLNNLIKLNKLTNNNFKYLLP